MQEYHVTPKTLRSYLFVAVGARMDGHRALRSPADLQTNVTAILKPYAPPRVGHAKQQDIRVSRKLSELSKDLLTRWVDKIVVTKFCLPKHLQHLDSSQSSL